MNETKLPHCTCPKQFAGEHCELCAPGYINYPTCLPDLVSSLRDGGERGKRVKEKRRGSEEII